jgi:hypothetical protein
VSRLLFFMAAAAVSGFCQVQVELRTNQATYLTGEPIFVVVDVKNIGPERVGYSASNGHADLTVPGGRKKEVPNLFGCFTGFGEGYGGGVFDPPLMKPGQTVSTWYLLKGYNLRAGDYILHASGKAGVQNYTTDPVAGQMFESSLKLTVEDATEAQLRQRYAPYVADAEGWDMERRARAREAIAEMAPPFLEKTILSFADQPETARLAVEGLAQIPTEERCSCIGGRCIGKHQGLRRDSGSHSDVCRSEWAGPERRLFGINNSYALPMVQPQRYSGGDPGQVARLVAKPCRTVAAVWRGSMPGLRRSITFG